MPVLLNRPDTAAGIKPVHESRQVPALVQAHADGQAAVEVGLADDVPAAPGEMLLVAGTGLQKEIELAVVLETDDVLATQAACDLAQDAALLLDDRRSGKEGVLSDKDSLFHSDDVWSVTNTSGRACGYVELLPAFHRPERDKATSVKQNEDKRYGFDTRTYTDRYICREV